MTPGLRKPTVRECERCGRRERWDDDREGWVIDRDDAAAGDPGGGERPIGDPYCIHEWDVTGSFVPFEEE